MTKNIAVVLDDGRGSETVEQVAKDSPDVALDHSCVDNAATQWLCAPKQFDMPANTDIFGDSFSNCVAMLSESIRMLPPALPNSGNKALI
jgi:isocitrate/isopropylmalate dehydrogenase